MQNLKSSLYFGILWESSALCMRKYSVPSWPHDSLAHTLSGVGFFCSESSQPFHPPPSLFLGVFAVCERYRKYNYNNKNILSWYWWGQKYYHGTFGTIGTFLWRQKRTAVCQWAKNFRYVRLLLWLLFCYSVPLYREAICHRTAHNFHFVPRAPFTSFFVPTDSHSTLSLASVAVYTKTFHLIFCEHLECFCFNL